MCLNMLRYDGHSLIPLLSLAFTYETHPHSHPHPPLSWPTPCLPMTPSPIKNSFRPPVFSHRNEKLCSPFPEPSFIKPQSRTLGLTLGWLHWARCPLAATAWWKQRDHMITLLLSVYICAFAGHHLYMHACMSVVIAAYNILNLCVSVGGSVCVCERECMGTCECMYAYFCIIECVLGHGSE